MTVDFDILKRKELRAAARLVGRAFEDYEYFTNYFPDLEERRKVLRGVVYREYLTNFKRTHYLVAQMNGEMVLFTNSDKNIAFYKRCGFEVFDEREFAYNGKTMRSWSVRKIHFKQ